ncbi:hypothetical protein RFI_27582 [Reticulomyxa filosa]|uniref:Protein kinase domain-containing protein n=1 Tax=Reticulomyxa filosa TaxID=46433 RepID=X6M9V6_RETFI|nr:hypothetical protein RFI_27582 [Reticulomyxa filosa]|eukprot:ETO09795.1 hypothetical protein RFI_27582 [Reticulomyxa filosa]
MSRYHSVERNKQNLTSPLITSSPSFLIVATFLHACTCIQLISKTLQEERKIKNKQIKKNRLHGAFTDNTNLYLSLELAKTDLLKVIRQYKKLIEAHVRFVVKSLLITLHFMHSHQFVHRDIKPENVALDITKRAKNGRYVGVMISNVRLIDFGSALINVNPEGVYQRKLVGTLFYMSPECFQKACYGWEYKSFFFFATFQNLKRFSQTNFFQKKFPKIIFKKNGITKSGSDVWAVGVLTYELLTGKRLFHGNSPKEVQHKIRHGMWCFPKESEDSVSTLAKSFVHALLTPSAKDRPTAFMSLQHPWFNSKPL